VSNSWQPVEVNTETAGPDFWARFHPYRRLRHSETHPDDPPEPNDKVEANLKRPDPFEFKHRYEISRDGQMLSWFTASAAKPSNPEYESSKHLIWANWSVHRDHRRQGMGRSWIPLVLELMERHHSTTLSVGSDEDSGHAFLKWLGAEAKLTGAENRLQFAEVDWDMVRRWAEEGPRRSPNTRLMVYDGHLPRELWEEYCPQLSSMLNTMPWEQLDHGDIVVTPAIMEEWYARMDLAGESHHVMFTREPDGTISGITDMFYAPYNPQMIGQAFTGVRPDERGRGLGKWLKAAMLLHVRELYPDLVRVTTDNAASNAPMLAINKRLGFKQYRAGSDYQISRDRLQARARELAAAR